MVRSAAATVLGLAILIAVYVPIASRAKVLGFGRRVENIHGHDLHVIPDTEVCEDLHYHASSGLLFTACQGSTEARLSWFPPLENFRDVNKATQGTITVVDPKTFKATNLRLENFNGPFVTHGIDVVDGEKSGTVYVFAVNHLPNPEHYSPAAGVKPAHHKGRSQIELFRHEVGSSTATHVRSIRSDLIETPNDIYAVSPTSFYVTNDHKHRGGIMRMIEEISTQFLAPWSTTIHVEIDELQTKDPEAGLRASVALRGLHNNNGLGHSSPERPNEIVIGDASGGVLTFTERLPQPGSSPKLRVLEQIQLESCIDNPSYYDDPYATAANNASGYVLAGLAEAYKLAGDAFVPEKPVPVLVWHLRHNQTETAANGGQQRGRKAWEQRLIFSDDGHTIRSASAAVLVPIDPAETKGQKQAWLFVSGFVSSAIVAAKVDL